MCVHEPLKRIILMTISKGISIPTDMLRNNLVLSIMASLVIVAVCIPIIAVVNKKLSWTIGKF